MRRDLFIYISGGISPKNGRSVEANIAAGVDLYLECLRRGLPAFLPHATAIFPSAHTAISYDKWLEYDCRVIDRCTHLLMMDGWRKSTGAVLEYHYALQENKIIIDQYTAEVTDWRVFDNAHAPAETR